MGDERREPPLVADDDEALQDRLKKRGSESQASFNRRVAELGTELADIENNDYVVRNRKNRLDQAVEELERIIERERQNPKRPAARLLS